MTEIAGARDPRGVAVDGLGRILLADTGRRIRGRLKIPVDDGVYGVDVTVVRWDERL